MSCCLPGGHQVDPANRTSEILLASRNVADGVRQTDLSVPGIYCGGCIQKIERALGGLPGVESARVNLSTKRVTIRWQESAEVPPFISTLGGLGYLAHLFDAAADDKDSDGDRLVRAMAVAGFAASNIMLLSVSVWSGADATRGTSFTGFPQSLPFSRWSTPAASSFYPPGTFSGVVTPIWMCQFRSASCSHSA